MDTASILTVIWAGVMPAVIVTGLVVNLAVNNILETRETARVAPKPRTRPHPRIKR